MEEPDVSTEEEAWKRSRTAQARYNRASRYYDLAEAWMERVFVQDLRRKQWQKVKGKRVLEIGVGTGKNIPYYPPGSRVSAVDISPGMLRGARRRAEKRGDQVDLIVADAEHLPFRDGAFDTSVATFVFCSVPNAVRGLREAARVTKQGGAVVLLEHVRSANRLVGKLMDWLNPVAVRLTGANINRNTVANVVSSGLDTEKLETLGLGIVKLIEAKP